MTQSDTDFLEQCTAVEAKDYDPLRRIYFANDNFPRLIALVKEKDKRIAELEEKLYRESEHRSGGEIRR